MTSSKLSWIHFFKASTIGFLLLPFLAAPAGIVYEWNEHAANPEAYAMVGKPNAWATAAVWALSGTIYGSIFLGIPAVLVNLLRLPLMRYLFAYCQDHGRGIGLALAGTFVIYEFPVGLVTLMMPSNEISGYPGWFFCFVISLPWLLSSWWATWSLRQALAVSVDEHL